MRVSNLCYQSEVLIQDVLVEANFCSISKGTAGAACHVRRVFLSLGYRGVWNLQFSHSCDCVLSYGIVRVGVPNFWLDDEEFS